MIPSVALDLVRFGNLPLSEIQTGSLSLAPVHNSLGLALATR